MFEHLKKYSKILVTGPQRSGTRICAKMIAQDTGYHYVDENDIAVDSLNALCKWLKKDDPIVIQCPALMCYAHLLVDQDVMVVVMHRKLEDILEANRLILESLEGRIEGQVGADSRIHGPVILEGGTRVSNSVIRGPAIIGADTEIIDSYIGPFTSIQRNCRILQTEIEHSIVLEGSEIREIGSRIDESLIGREVRIFRSAQRPSVYRFMVGDKSEIGIK